MPDGIPVSKLHEVFKKRVDALRDEAELQGKAIRAEEIRPWQVPKELADILDIPKLHEPAFKREEINENYLEAVSGSPPGVAGDTVALKLQMDWNAAEERAFRTRHATVIRCMAHSMTHRKGHGTEKGVLDNVRKMVEDTIKAGRASQ